MKKNRLPWLKKLRKQVNRHFGWPKDRKSNIFEDMLLLSKGSKYTIAFMMYYFSGKFETFYEALHGKKPPRIFIK